MSGQRQSCNNQRNSYVSLNITILVVDDDSVSLAIVSAMLRKWSYQVAAVKDPVVALSILRQRPGQFDLVVTDLHMPQMDGIQLQKHICAEFQVPVIIMSSDDKESVILESLAFGAAFFIVKPIKPVDLKNVWQHAISAKKGKSLQMENTMISSSPQQQPLRPDKTLGPSSSNTSTARNSSDQDGPSDGYHNRKRKARRNSGDESDNGTEGEDDGDDSPHPAAPKKAKVVWTNSLHNRFLQAIRHIGLDKAVPKKILEYMNVPGLTRENVASHLQKYRMFLKRVAEKSASTTESLTEKTLKSSFASGHGRSLVELAQEYFQLTQQQQMLSQGTKIQAGLGRPVSTPSVTGIGSMHFPTQVALTNTSMPQLGFAKTNSPINQSSFHNTSSWTDFGGGTGNYVPNMSTNRALISDGTTVRTCLPNMSSLYDYGGTTNKGVSNYSTSLNQLSNGYDGIKICSIENLVGMSQTSKRVDGSSGGGFGFVKGTDNFPAAENQTSRASFGGIGDYEIDLMKNGVSSSLENITNSQQQMGGTNNQLQGGGDLDQLLNQLLNYDFSSISTIEEGGQNGKEGEVRNKEQTSMTGLSNEATYSENQQTHNEQGSWEEDFLDSLLGFNSP